MSIFNSGTKTIFHQTSAPTGWTKETVNYNDHALRVVNGSSLSSGGSVDFITALRVSPYTFTTVAFPYTLGATTLDISRIPAHNHTIGPSGTRFAVTSTAPTLTPTTSPLTSTNTTGSLNGATNPNGVGGGSHTHPMTVTASGNVFSNSPNSSLEVNYIDVIIATLN